MPTKLEIYTGIMEGIRESGRTLIDPQAHAIQPPEKAGRFYLANLLKKAMQEAMEHAGDDWGPKGSVGRDRRNYTPDQAHLILEQLRDKMKSPRSAIRLAFAGVTETALDLAAEKLKLETPTMQSYDSLK